MKKKFYNTLFLLYLPVCDFFLILISVYFSYELYLFLDIGKNLYYAGISVFQTGTAVSFLTVLVMKTVGVYKTESGILHAEEMKNVIKGISIGLLLTGFVLVFADIRISRYILAFSYGFSLLSVIAGKAFFYRMLSFMGPVSGFHKRILIYGAGELGRALFREIANSPRLGILPVGFIDDDPEKQGSICYRNGFNCENGLRVLGKGEDIENIVRTHQADEVCIAISNIHNGDLLRILNHLKDRNIRISLVPGLSGMMLHRIRLCHVSNCRQR